MTGLLLHAPFSFPTTHTPSILVHGGASHLQVRSLIQGRLKPPLKDLDQLVLGLVPLLARRAATTFATRGRSPALRTRVAQVHWKLEVVQHHGQQPSNAHRPEERHGRLATMRN